MNAATEPHLFDRSDLNHVRRTIRESVGNQVVNDLHKENLFLDLLIVTFVTSGAIFVAIALGHIEFGLTWCLLFISQGLLAQLTMLVSHDLFVHRKVGGDFWSWIGSMLLTIPRLSIPSGYETAHLAHHKYIGTERDTEKYKQDIDTSFKRLLFSTFPGVKLAQSNKFTTETRKHYHESALDSPQAQKRVMLEKRVLKIWLVILAILCVLFPKVVILGYVLPVITILPIMNSLRITIEHSDINPTNPFNQSTFYETGIFSRLLFLWDSGDCHIVHHIFPRMPWYRVGAAVDKIKPVLEENGAVKRTSFWRLVKGWYIDNYPHRTRWPDQV